MSYFLPFVCVFFFSQYFRCSALGIPSTPLVRKVLAEVETQRGVMLWPDGLRTPPGIIGDAGCCVSAPYALFQPLA